MKKIHTMALGQIKQVLKECRDKNKVSLSIIRKLSATGETVSENERKRIHSDSYSNKGSLSESLDILQSWIEALEEDLQLGNPILPQEK
jgi:hypothetical protein